MPAVEHCDIAVVTGGRDYHLTAADRAWLDAMLDRHGFRILLHGDATGADCETAGWALERKLCVAACPAQWEAYRRKYGSPRKAGPDRNMRMAWALEHMRAIALAFPGGKGTENMIQCCRRMGVQVHPSPSRDAQQSLFG